MLNKYPEIDLELGNQVDDITPLLRCNLQENDFPDICFGDPRGKDIGNALVTKGAKVVYGSGLDNNCLLVVVQENHFLAAKCLWLARC